MLSAFADSIYRQKYSKDGKEEWVDTAWRVPVHVLGALGYSESSDEVLAAFKMIRNREFLPGGRYLYASGRPLHQVNNCLLLGAEDSREGWGDLWQKAGMALMTGAGIGVEYSQIRPKGSLIKRTGGEASGPTSLMHTVNEIGRQVMQGGSRRSAIWAGLGWDHPDVLDFIRLKDWSAELRALKLKDFNFPLPMEFTNISVRLDDLFFRAYNDPMHPLNGHAHEVYWKVIEKMTVTGEPGFSVDTGENTGEVLRNACTEVTSRDDSDVCNLGSINLARITDEKRLREVLEIASLFLVAGTVYSDVPYEKVAEVRTLNRRLGLGLMGLHEWLIVRGHRYGPNEELGRWLGIYAETTEMAGRWADAHSLSRPVKTRAIAPNGTIGIIGETTTGIEPVFCAAFKRRYLKGSDWHHQYVLDPTVERITQEHGIDASEIEDAYSLDHGLERRVEMQRFVQGYVDHGISSTINIDRPFTDEGSQRKFGNMLIEHLPHLRGITVYPDGARGGQPLEPVDYAFARSQVGRVFEESEDRCVGGACGV